MQNLLITGIIGLLIGAIAFSSQPSTSQSPSPIPSPITQPSQPTSRNRRLTITVAVGAMTDLKVTEGQSLQAGDIIADRTPSRQRLQTQKARLSLSLSRLQTATITPPRPPANPPTIAALPDASFLEAQAQVETAKAAVDRISAQVTNKQTEIAYLATLPHLKPIVLDHERAKLAELQQQHTATVREYQLAMARLSSAQDQRAYREYQHSLSLAERTEARNRDDLEYQRQIADFEQRHRDRDYQIAQTQLKLNEIDNQLATLAAVRAPAAGKVRRIKWLGQSPDGQLNAELTFITARPGRDTARRRTAPLPQQPTRLSDPTDPSRDPEQFGIDDD